MSKNTTLIDQVPILGSDAFIGHMPMNTELPGIWLKRARNCTGFFNFFSGSPIDLFDGSEADHRLTNQCKLSIEAWLTGLIDKSLQNSLICSCFIFIYNPSFVQINFTMLDKYMHSVYCYKLVSKEFWSWQAVYISDMYFPSGYNKVKNNLWSHYALYH